MLNVALYGAPTAFFRRKNAGRAEFLIVPAKKLLPTMPVFVDRFHFFQSLGEPAAHPRGFEAPLDHERLRVEVLRADLLRIRISRGGRFEESPSNAVCAEFPALAPDAFRVEAAGETITLTTESLVLVASRAPFALRATRNDGSVIFETAGDAATGQSRAYGELNESFVVTRTCAREDAFYGLGEKTGAFNRKGRTFTLWNTDVFNTSATDEFIRDRPAGDPRKNPSSTEFDPYYVSIPFFYHHPAAPIPSSPRVEPMAGFFIDNPWRGEFEFAAGKTYRFVFRGGSYVEYVFAGPRMPAILEAYTALTGRMAPPPLWALGHHQCRWHDYTQAQVANLANTYRERQIPCDVIWLDIDAMDGYRVFTWDPKKFPDPPALIAHLREQGLRVITIIDPGVKHERGNPLFEAGCRDRLFCEAAAGQPFVGRVWPGDTVFPDFSLPETREWWGRLNANHVRFGIAGIWNDMNEPSTFNGNLEAMRFQHGEVAHARFHNEYALLMAMGTVEGLRAAMPERRTFVLSRAGSAGIQRYAANWLGDNGSNWDMLWLSLPMAAGLGISGQPFVGADVGGFGESCDGELLGRWYQYAAFTPFFRNHNCTGCRDQYPWSFGAACEAICVAAIRERYRLLPYLYASFMLAAESGAPIQRPLIFDAQEDVTTRTIDDQFLLGPHLLVAPVTKRDQTSRHVYLPAGDWRDWWTGEAVSGGRHLLVPTPRDRIPVYVRAGAVIPLWGGQPQTTQDHFPEEIELLMSVPLEDGDIDSILHEDDGLTFAHTRGAYYRTNFRLSRRVATLTLTAEVTGDGFPEFRRRRFRLRFPGLAAPPRFEPGDPAVSIDGDALVVANAGSSFALTFPLSAS